MSIEKYYELGCMHQAQADEYRFTDDTDNQDKLISELSLALTAFREGVEITLKNAEPRREQLRHNKALFPLDDQQ